MRNLKLYSQIQRINSLVGRTDAACSGNLELQAEWARFLCVIVAGLIENAIKELYKDFAEKKFPTPLANFVNNSLSPIRSPKATKFLDVAGSFKPNWRDDLESYLNDEGRGEAIDSIINQRHLIAHGKSQQSNITLASVKDYLEKIIEVLDFIEDQCER